MSWLDRLAAWLAGVPEKPVMPDPVTVIFYKGRPATHLTHEELYVAFVEVCQQLETCRDIHREDMRIKQLYADAMRVMDGLDNLSKH